MKKVDVHKILWYFIIFSILGLIIETVYCYVTEGKLENRKGLVWGPFCPIYGVGASAIIIIWGNSNKSIKDLFIEGVIIGSIVEYIISFILEAIYGIRFWDYSYLSYNLNGRIAIIYSLFWGLLAVVLIKFISPFINKLIKKIPKNNILNIGLIIFFIVDSICTVWAIQAYKSRILNKNIEINTIKQQIENKLFSNEFMSKTFPNLRIKNEKGEEVFIKEYL